MKRNITSEQVLSIYRGLEERGIKIWIDGGWAVDALLGKETRPHQDLDIALQNKNYMQAKRFFEEQGYAEIERTEDKKWDIVLGNPEGLEVEIHTFNTNEHGDTASEPYWNGYDAKSLKGEGWISGYPVRCVSIDQLVKTHDHTKRSLKQTDYQDIQLLEEKFGIKF